MTILSVELSTVKVNGKVFMFLLLYCISKIVRITYT